MADLTAVSNRPQHLARLPFRNPADVQRITDGLAKAGLPD
jgi:hypothetical protein